MILTDREIKIAIDRRLIVIDPRPEDRAFSSTSVDLRLDSVISLYKEAQPGLDKIVDSGVAGFNQEAVVADLTDRVEIGTDGFVLYPRRLALAWTREYVDLKLDARVAARVEGKSSLARLGLGVHMTAPTIHAGFNGRIRLEMINHGTIPIRLRSGMQICQLIFEQTLGTPDSGYRGQFLGQSVPQRG